MSNQQELDLILAVAGARLDTVIIDEFEKALAEQGLEILSTEAEPLLALGRKAFGTALILIAAGSPQEARDAVFNLEDPDERLLARIKARKASHEEGVLQQDAYDFLGSVAITALKAALPFVLAAL